VRLAPTILLILLAGCSSSTGSRIIEVEVCSRAAVDDALASAEPGDTVRFGGCILDGGALTIPADIGLEGAGPTASVVEVDGGIIADGAAEGCTTIRNMRIVSAGGAGITTAGPGDVCVEDVEIEASLGAGISAEGTTRLVVRRTRLIGPVTPENRETTPAEESTESYGIFARCVGHIELENVDARGWALGGVRIASGRLTWNGGYAGNGLDTGIFLSESEAVIDDVEIAEILPGRTSISAYGLTAIQSRVETRNLIARDNSVGALHIGGDAHHADGRFSNNGESGVWVQGGALVIEGSDFDGNGLAGILTVSASDLRIEDTRLAGTRLVTRLVGEVGTIELGSGLLVSGHDAPLTLTRVQIEDNEGWGALGSLVAGYDHPFALEDVTVSPAMYGFGIAGGPPPTGWQAGVSPPEATAEAIEDPFIAFLDRPGMAGLPTVGPSCD